MDAISNFNKLALIANNQKQITAQNDAAKQTKQVKISSKKALIGAACLSAAVIGGLVYKGQINKVKNLEGLVNFKNAQTLDEAINFGKISFGIKEYKGFETKDLDVVNWINEGLASVNNKTKGKAKMPEVIEYVDSLSNGAHGKTKGTAGGCMDENGVLKITNASIEMIKGRVVDYIKKFETNPEKQQKILKQLKNSKNYKDYKSAYIKYLDFIPDFKKKVFNQINTSEFNEIYHEMGHWQHMNNVDKYLVRCLSRPWSVLEQSNYNLHPDAQKLHELFLNSKNITDNMTDYAKLTPAEFVAECYSFMCDGVKLSDEIVQLYKKLGGVMV